jgi:hypothetical protein
LIGTRPVTAGANQREHEGSNVDKSSTVHGFSSSGGAESFLVEEEEEVEDRGD